jgi:hypothetical protein
MNIAAQAVCCIYILSSIIKGRLCQVSSSPDGKRPDGQFQWFALPEFHYGNDLHIKDNEYEKGNLLVD